MRMCLELEIGALFEMDVQYLRYTGRLDPKLFIYSEMGDLVADPFDLSDIDLALRVIRGQAKTTNAYMILISYTMILRERAKPPLQAIYAYGETEFERIGIYQEFVIDDEELIFLGNPKNMVLEGHLVRFFS